MRFLSATVAGLAGPRYFGLDLAKRETQLSVLNAAGEQVYSKRFATTREQFLKLAHELRAGDLVALEVTTNAVAIARLVRDNSPARIILSNPIKTKVIAQAKIKTDKIDARVLAELARVGYLPEVWLPDEATESLRQFHTDRTSLVHRRTELKNTVHAILHRNLVPLTGHSDLFGARGRGWLEQLVRGDELVQLPMPQLDRLRLGSLLSEIDRLDALIADLERVIAAYIAVRPHLQVQLDRLLSLTGVGLVVASGLMAAIGDIRRFPDKKKLAAYFGVVPSTSQSGDTSRHGRITKQGRAEARWLLVEAAEIMRRSPGPLRALYARICGKRGHNVAVVAVARKLIELVHHLLTREEDYLYRLPRLTQTKRADCRHLARQKLGVKLKSAALRAHSRSVLYGAGLNVRGPKLKTEAAQLAAAQAERLYQAVVEQRAARLRDPAAPVPPGFTAADLAFNPTQPNETDWEKLLAAATERVLRKYQKAAAQKAATDNSAN